MGRFAASLVILGLAACTTNLKLADELAVTCTGTGLCPDGRVCAEDIGTCVVPGEACVSANGGRYHSEPDGNQCPLAGGDGICLAGACVHSSCGDGYADTTRGELCDSGLDNDDSTSDACRSNCLPARCGDGVIDLGLAETCDDGNTASGDGCSQTCKKVEVCGDSFVDAGEDCDDGNANANDGCNACTATTWNAELLAGFGLGGGDPLTTPVFESRGVGFDSIGNLYVGEYARLRRLDIASRHVTTVAGNGVFPTGTLPDTVSATQGAIYNPSRIAIDNRGIIFITDGTTVVRKVDRGTMTRVIGTGGNNCNAMTSQGCGDGGPPKNAVTTVSDLAIDGIGNLYIADTRRIRRIDFSTDNVSTIAGNGQRCSLEPCGDGAAASAATFYGSQSIAIDSHGAVYILDTESLPPFAGHRIRRMESPAPNAIISTYAGTGGTCASGTCGEGQVATSTPLNMAFGSNIVVDTEDNLYFVDVGSTATPLLRVRRIDAGTKIITTVAGGTICALHDGPCGDGGPAINAQLHSDYVPPSQVARIAVAPDGSIAIAEQANRVRLVDPNGTITTATGNGTLTILPVGVAATTTAISERTAAFDSAGNLFVVDGDANSVIYHVDLARPALLPFAGIAQAGVTDPGGDGPASQISMNVRDIAVDSHDNVYYVDDNTYQLRRIDKATGAVNTIVGNGAWCPAPTGTCGDGPDGHLALFSGPHGIAVDANDDVFVADTDDNKIRKVSMQSCSAANGWQCPVSTIAGTGSYGNTGDGGTATAATLSCPWKLTVKQDGTIYFTELLSCSVRSITGDGKIHTVRSLGTPGSCPVASPSDGCIPDSLPSGQPELGGITAQGSDLFYVDLTNHVVHRVDSLGTDTVVMGAGGSFSDDIPGAQIALSFPSQVMSRPGQLMVVDQSSVTSLRVTDLTTFTAKTLAGDIDGPLGGPLATSVFTEPRAITPAPGLLGWLVADGNGGRLRRLALASDWTDVVVGFPGGHSDVGGWPARSTKILTVASAIAVDVTGHAIYAIEQVDPATAKIHKITTPNPTDATTWVSTEWYVSPGAALVQPAALAFDDRQRLLLVADTGHNLVQAFHVDDVTPTLHIVAGQVGHRGYAGEGIPATGAVLDGPAGLAVAPDGTLYIADTGNNRVRWVDAAGLIWTVIGDGVAASSGQGSPASAFPVDTPRGLALDSFGNLYISSRTAVRMITASGSVGESLADRPVRTIYGAYPRAKFPDAITECIVGVSVAQDDASVAAIDQCKGLIVRLTRTVQ